MEACLLAKVSSWGCSVWHGTHQLAKKFTTTYWPRIDDRVTVLPSRSGPEMSGATLPSSGLSALPDSADFRVPSSTTNSATTTPTLTATQRRVCGRRGGGVAPGAGAALPAGGALAEAGDGAVVVTIPLLRVR